MTEQTDAAPQPPTCRNCEAHTTGPYCAQCGQQTDITVPTFAEFVGDYLNGLFSLDARIWRTLGILLSRPGALTLAYFEGRRARYIAPLKLYLIASIFLFLVVSLPDGVPDGEDVDPDFTSGSSIRMDGEQAPLDEVTADACENLIVPFAEIGGDLHQRFIQACQQNAANDFAGVKDAFVDNLPLLAFLVIPVMAAVFCLCYPFAGRRYIEHLTLLFHTHAFSFCLLGLLTLGGRVGALLPLLSGTLAQLLWALVLVCLPVYFYLSLRRVYAQGSALTLLKLALLMTLYAVVAMSVFATGFFLTMLTA